MPQNEIMTTFPALGESSRIQADKVPRRDGRNRATSSDQRVRDDCRAGPATGNAKSILGSSLN